MTKAVTLAGLAENHMQSESYLLMEPDTVALNNILATGKERLGKKIFEQTLVQGRSLRLEDVVAQELSSAS